VVKITEGVFLKYIPFNELSLIDFGLAPIALTLYLEISPSESKKSNQKFNYSGFSKTVLFQYNLSPSFAE
jgi:hypothetical protein